MRNLKYLFLLALIFGLGSTSWAHIDPNKHSKNATSNTTIASLRMDCAQGTSKVVQSINNVRAMLLNGGDVWWDLEDGQYVVPTDPPALVSRIALNDDRIGSFYLHYQFLN